jgi:hypothetical protein
MQYLYQKDKWALPVNLQNQKLKETFLTPFFILSLSPRTPQLEVRGTEVIGVVSNVTCRLLLPLGFPDCAEGEVYFDPQLKTR